MGIIRNLKVLYRIGVVRKLVEDINSVSIVIDFVRKLIMLDVIYFLFKVWKNVKMIIIVNCYRKIGFFSEEVEVEEEIVVFDGMTREEFYKYIDYDKDLECYRVFFDEEFIKDEFSDIEESNEEDIEIGSGDFDDEIFININGVKKCMEYIRRFLEENGCDDFNDYYGFLEKCEIIVFKNKKIV